MADLFFPRRCIICGRSGDYLCPGCIATLLRLLPPLCPGCGLPISVEPCPACRQRKPEIDGIYAPFRFEGPARQAVHLLNYQNIKALAPTLAGFMASHIRLHPLPVEAIVPVPLHRARMRRRGYNQAELLAYVLGQGLGLPVNPGWLERDLPGYPQAPRTTSREERWRNATGAFRAKEAMPAKRVLLVDDVCTTGATLSSFAVALKGAGAVQVWGLTLAREI